MNVAYYKFDIDDNSGDLDSNRPVPFRYRLYTKQFFTYANINYIYLCLLILSYWTWNFW